MNRDFHQDDDGERSGRPSPEEVDRFVEAVLGRKPTPTDPEVKAREDRKFLEWAAKISTTHEQELRDLERKEEAERKNANLSRWVDSVTGIDEAQWDPSKHPRAPKGESDGGQWVATSGSGGGAGSAGVAGDGSAGSPFKTVSLKSPDSASFWKGAVLTARSTGLPTALIDWNAKDNTTIDQNDTPKFQPGRLWGGTIYLDKLRITRLSRIGNAGKYDSATDFTALGNVYNEAFHAWFLGNKGSLGWLLPVMDKQKQFLSQIRDKAEEAMSEAVNQIINDLETKSGILTYEELMKLKPNDERRHNLTPGHNEVGQRRWDNNAGSEKEMTEELYYASIWVLYNGNKTPVPKGGNQLDALKKFFADKFHPEWGLKQFQDFVKSRY